MTPRRALLALLCVCVCVASLSACSNDKKPAVVMFSDTGPRDGATRDSSHPGMDGAVDLDGGSGDGDVDGGGVVPGLCTGDNECALGIRLRACCECPVGVTRGEIDSDECVVAMGEPYSPDQRAACMAETTGCTAVCHCTDYIGVGCDRGMCGAYTGGTCRFDTDCTGDERCRDRNGDGRTECISTRDYCEDSGECTPPEVCRDDDGDHITTCGAPIECTMDLECCMGLCGPCVNNVCLGRAMPDGGVRPTCTSTADCTAMGSPPTFVCMDYNGDSLPECIPDPTPCGGCSANFVCQNQPGDGGTVYACVPAVIGP